MRKLSVFFFLLVACLANGQGKFKTLRFDEDFHYLDSVPSPTIYERIKYKRLSSGGNAYLSWGGEIRQQYFLIKNDKWGDGPRDTDGYYFSRLLFHADLHVKHFRVFAQLQSSLANGKPVTTPVDENPLELHQGFIQQDFKIKHRTSIMLRAGRQEFLYGSQRLVSVRDGPNNRQSFDGIKTQLRSINLKLDLFYTGFVVSRKGLFDDKVSSALKFWGAYLVLDSVNWLKHVDLYYMGLRKRVAVFNDGTGRELRHSIGGRIWEGNSKWRYDIEGVYQFGKLATKQIRAWTLSFNTGYRFIRLKGKPELGLKTEFISGDARFGDHVLGTFNPLFPRGGYFGLASIIGPSNLFDIHPSLGFSIGRNIAWNLDADLFWRLSREDGIYGPNVALLYKGENNPYSSIGRQLATDLVYTPNEFLYLRAELTWFKADDFLKYSSAGRNILFAGFTVQLRF